MTIAAHNLNVDSMFAAYIEAALWSTNDESTPSGGVPMDDRYTLDDIHPDSLAKMRADVERFAAENADDIATWESPRWTEEEMSGHDFWLTRNGHGCGFWDGDWREDAGDRLTDAARAFGECDLYVGDDGLVHVG